MSKVDVLGMCTEPYWETKARVLPCSSASKIIIKGKLLLFRLAKELVSIHIVDSIFDAITQRN